jgi:hypothetical protein
MAARALANLSATSNSSATKRPVRTPHHLTHLAHVRASTRPRCETHFRVFWGGIIRSMVTNRFFFVGSGVPNDTDPQFSRHVVLRLDDLIIDSLV